VASLSCGDVDSPNMLIEGDNLDALKALLPYYAGQVKCIFIDPPYNTGSAFEHYDDNIEHSTWLSMMYPRLELLRELLSEDGSIWVTIDDNEAHYLKVLMDEIYGRKNFVADITYERSGSAGLGQGGEFVRNAEHILAYKKGNHEFNEVLGSMRLEAKTMKRYNKILLQEGSRELVREFKAKSNGMPVRVFQHKDFSISTISLAGFEKRESEIRAQFAENFECLFRTNNVQKENEFQNDLMSGMDKKHLYTVEYTPNRGKNANSLTKLYYFNAELFAWLKDTAYLEGGQIVKTNKLTTVWTHGEIPKADLANEGQVDFPRSKKPEQLIRRILEIATNPGDLVLDSFLGSGTTAAVAHKMGRRWIGIEMGEHARTHCQPRLKKVVDGEQGGISEAVGWKGGGGFRYFKLGKPVFDPDGRIDESIRFEHLAAHVWFAETGIPRSTRANKSAFLGEHAGIGYYLLFNDILGDERKETGNVLTRRLLRSLPKFDGPKVIYGEACDLSDDQLREFDIAFRQTPYDIKAR
jgi:adenine-specific DNA-methyltransferase